MALTALIRLSEQLLNETAAAQGAGSPQTPVNATGNTTNSPAAPAARDQFVPSTQNNAAAANAEAAGLFRVAQSSLFTAAADSLLAQTAPARQRNAASQPAPAAGVLFEPAAQGAGVINPAAKQATDLAAATHTPAAANANANNANTADAATALPQPVAAATTTANATSAGTANATAAGAASVQAELQALNNTLAALGLNATDIRKVDQIASLINDFNPAAFIRLAYQLERFAQNAAQQSAAAAANTAAHAPTATGSNGATAAGNNAAAAPAGSGAVATAANTSSTKAASA